jgi:pimeloyl-ACP methyl ester carboxylesterase
LKDWINENKIAKDRPLHLIGHSAGGYAVARCALFLKRYGVAPAQTHITILDTPVSLRFSGFHPSENELLKDLPGAFPGAVDFYVTSDLVKLPRTFTAPGLHLYWPPHQSESPTKDHQFAYEWFIKTVEDENFAPGEGFSRSPLLNKN